jgi:pyrroloquinoline quinone biosynthesis protein D
LLVRHARYRWDRIRGQHQLVFPEGVLVLNATAAMIVRLCDGRSTGELIAALTKEFPGAEPTEEVLSFLKRLVTKGLVHDAADA